MKFLSIFLLIIFLAGCVQVEESSEFIGDNAEIITKKSVIQGKEFEMQDIKYEIDGEEFQNYFDPMYKDSLDWVRENLPQDAVFLCWWDYGHMIRGYTAREVVIFSPSKEILWSLASGKWDEEGSGSFSTSEQIEDVALALTTTDSGETKDIMEKYNADYIFVTIRDIPSSFILYKIAGFDETEYIDDNYQPRDKAFDSVLFRFLDKDDVEGFELVYDDETVKIYKQL